MGILRDIWNTIFGKKNQDNRFERGGSIAEPLMKVVHNKNEDKIDAGRTYTENELGEDNPQVCNNVQQIPSTCSEDLPKPKPKRKKSKSIVGQKTLNEIKEYLITYGSLDVLTCEQKFKVKSLHNFIWFLRNEGFEIKTDKVGLHNELGQKVEVTNYTLITKK
jgi:hypothetical protein